MTKKNVKKCRKLLVEEVSRARKQKKKWRQKKRPFPRYSEATNVMLRHVYRFVSSYLKSESQGRLKKRFLEHTGRKKRDYPENPFAMGLWLLLPTEETAWTNAISKYAPQLAYAYDHDVDELWLSPFLQEIGGYQGARNKRKAGEFEPWLETRPKHPIRGSSTE